MTTAESSKAIVSEYYSELLIRLHIIKSTYFCCYYGEKPKIRCRVIISIKRIKNWKEKECQRQLINANVLYNLVIHSKCIYKIGYN